MAKIKTLESYLDKIHAISWDWNSPPNLWFRGQPIDKLLKPKLFRGGLKSIYDENGMTQTFRNRALAYGKCSEYSNYDEWLFLMQHYGLPTRLLDWTESSLIAQYFSIYGLKKFQDHERAPVVWVLNPKELN